MTNEADFRERMREWEAIRGALALIDQLPNNDLFFRSRNDEKYRIGVAAYPEDFTLGAIHRGLDFYRIVEVKKRLLGKLWVPHIFRCGADMYICKENEWKEKLF